MKTYSHPANGEGHHAMYRVSDGKWLDHRNFWDDIQPKLDACKPSERLLEEAAALANPGIVSEYLI